MGSRPLQIYSPHRIFHVSDIYVTTGSFYYLLNLPHLFFFLSFFLFFFFFFSSQLNTFLLCVPITLFIFGICFAFYYLHINEIIQYLPFSICLISLSIIHYRSVLGVINGISFFVTIFHFIEYMENVRHMFIYINLLMATSVSVSFYCK